MSNFGGKWSKTSKERRRKRFERETGPGGTCTVRKLTGEDIERLEAGRRRRLFENGDELLRAAARNAATNEEDDE